MTPRGGPPMTSHVDLFLKAANPGERAQTLVVRGAITVPTEGKRAALTDTHAALEARQETISRLLGDAENPAHTRWNERAERLRNGWQSGGMVLRRVRAALHELHAVVFDRLDREDTDALVDFFSIPKPTRGGKGATVVSGQPRDPRATFERVPRISEDASSNWAWRHYGANRRQTRCPDGNPFRQSILKLLMFMR
jgi:hypothetical protein